MIFPARPMVETTKTIVIALGGGGIPVILESDGSYRRVEAAIDKYLAGEKLAESVGAPISILS